MIDPHIFRAYDIRGDVRTQLTPQASFDIGRALAAAHFAPGSTLCIGRDARMSSPQLSQNLIQGLTRMGVNVVDLGQITTPMLYFALFDSPFDGGVMVTGSHNPVHDNGLKICRKTQSFLKSDIQAILDKIGHVAQPAVSPGYIQTMDIAEKYEQCIWSRVKPARKLNLVLDAGNGVAGPYVAKILGAYAQNIQLLYCEPDGAFPNHHPDPSELKNMEACRQAVLAHHADLGLAFDGDGDRLGVVDKNGLILPADKLLILFAREILSRLPYSTIIGDIKCSKFTFDDIRKNHGTPCMSKTGHALIKAKIRETQAALAGEMSGHFFFADRWFGFDDAIYAAARICEIAASSSLSLTEMLSDVPQSFATPELRLDCPDDVKFKLAEDMADIYQNRYPMSRIDGARIDFPTGWALIRASNTQPVIVLRVEAISKIEAMNIIEDLRINIEHFNAAHQVDIDLSKLNI